MSVDQNKALIRRLYDEALNKGNLEVVDEIISPNYVRHGLAPGAPVGPESTKQVFTMMRTGFPDLFTTVEPMLGEGDMVAAQLTHHGTHKGEFMGIAPTGKQVTVATIGIYRLVGNKLEESWIQMDMHGMLQQLGAVPPTG